MRLSMGSYLSTPQKEKFSSDESSDKLLCGASSMQGWRLTQEDAHNCLLDYDSNAAFFAVYDGHGGHEVAEYCSQYLPDFIKQTEAYKNDDLKKALVDGFLGFDTSITTPDVIKELKRIAQERTAKEEGDDDVDEENVDNLYEEAAMPIEKVIEKYTANAANRANSNKDGEGTSKSPKKNKLENDNAVGSSSGCSSSMGPSSSSAASSSSRDGSNDVASSSTEENEAKCVEKVEDENGEVEKESAASKDETKPSVAPIPDSSDAEVTSEADVKGEKKSEEKPMQNGDSSQPDGVSSSSPSQENGDISKKGKGKSPMKKQIKSPEKPVNDRPKRNAAQLYKKILALAEAEDSEDTEDEEDKTFSVPNEAASSDEDADGVNTSADADNSDATSEDEAEEEEEEEEDEDEDDDYDHLENMKEEPGSDSGCTAVVAVLKGNELYVANAGDSRCVVCRNGKAVEMSLDHKPEDTEERERIQKAGGRVTSDGRVNNGLNLSRAIGDHAYKQNKELSDREQMITALPDIRTLTINPKEDEFMVLACDGIWNSMDNQEVVDFVRTRITEGKEKLSQICEEMFDHCLADDSHWDGIGMDNMTAIIVQFKSTLLKRSASPDRDASNSKMAKTDTNESQVDTTA